MNETAFDPRQIRELFDYDESTGHLIWKQKRVGVRVRDGKLIAGCRRPDGYIVVRIDGKAILAHRVVWAWVHGEWPSGDIDHINMVKSDNRLQNLRAATRSENFGNLTARKHNRVGVKNVFKAKTEGKWIARIRKDFKSYHLGTFDSIEQARAAHREAALRLYGAFAKLDV